MPGGVNSPARAFGAVGGTPLFIEKAEGPYLFDIDGNQYVDYIGSWGPMILGHRPPQVVEAIIKAVEKGTSYGAPTEAETGLAQQIIEAVPSVEKVRLVNSGTEATMSAIRVARGATGRNKIIKFSGNYHGHVDSLLVAAGSAAATLGVPDSPGVTPGAGQDTLVLDYNDVQGVKDAFAKYPGEIAAVILEPVVGNMGCVPATREFSRIIARRDAQGQCDSDFRRSHDWIPTRLWWCARALWNRSRHDHTWKNRRWRNATGSLRRPRRHHGQRASGRKGLSGRNA